MGEDATAPERDAELGGVGIIEAVLLLQIFAHDFQVPRLRSPAATRTPFAEKRKHTICVRLFDYLIGAEGEAALVVQTPFERQSFLLGCY